MGVEKRHRSIIQGGDDEALGCPHLEEKRHCQHGPVCPRYTSAQGYIRLHVLIRTSMYIVQQCMQMLHCDLLVSNQCDVYTFCSVATGMCGRPVSGVNVKRVKTGLNPYAGRGFKHVTSRAFWRATTHRHASQTRCAPTVRHS